MAKKDYYAILGVDKNATADDIKAAYRKKAKLYHPDLHPNDKSAAEKFKDCNEAYEVLGNEENRRKYDSGEMDFEGFQFSGGMPHGFEDIFDSIFGSFMGSRTARSAAPVGSDVTQTVDLTFMDAAKGASKEITFYRQEKCAACSGNGAASSADLKNCDKCGGKGRVQYVTNSIFGRQMTIGTCDKCGGSGKIISNPCKTCNGRGVVSKKKALTINIPAGVENGAILSITGQGHASKAAEGINGNLLLVINVATSPVFKRDGLNLYVEAPVSYAVAVNGGDIEIPTLNGVEIQRINEGTANGEVFRLRSKGIKTSRRAGDLFIKVVVEVPIGVSKKDKKALEELENSLSLKNYPRRKLYLDNLNKAFNK
mgnify:CR=1 FL=1